MTELIIPATDGFPLGATAYGVPGPSSMLVVVAAATGAPQRYYRRFAEYLAARGHLVVTFDYRGLAASRRGPLRDFQADFIDWAQKDLQAVTDWALARGPTAVVGHSFGGQAFGLLARANETLGLLAFGTGTGWHGHMPWSERPRVLFLWHVVGPVVTRALGYLPSARMGLGEDLPLGVYRQWRRWCGRPGHWFDDPERDFARAFARVRVPVVAFNSTDDRWATPRSAARFMAGYSAAAVELRTVGPAAVGGRPIGHMGYFRAGVAEPLWDQTHVWLQEQAARRSGRGTP
jgi:predicted alpha/beta hydrolase